MHKAIIAVATRAIFYEISSHDDEILFATATTACMSLIREICMQEIVRIKEEIMNSTID